MGVDFAMSSGALQVGIGPQRADPSFVQRGQVDWVAFGNTIWSASAAALQRFGNAGVQPFTYGARLALASQFHLRPLGQRRIEEAIQNLRGVPALDNLLWFGFGYQSFVKTMAEILGGIKCVALCSCLADVHIEEAAAWVLVELWKTLKYPEEYEPSHAQFRSLIKVCTRVLAKTTFNQTIDIMLGDYLWRTPAGSHGFVEASNARDIAKALHDLFRISKGEVDSITVTGSSECAFIAAMALWLFNLSALVEGAHQEVIFRNTPDGDTAQVIAQFGDGRDKDVQIAATTYVLGDCRELFNNIRQTEEWKLIIRTTWDGCLERVFGPTLQRLSSVSQLLGNHLGAAARIYGARALGVTNVGTFSRPSYIDFVEASHGSGLIDTVIDLFPELQGTMRSALGLSFDDAFITVRQSIRGLTDICDCLNCTR